MVLLLTVGAPLGENFLQGLAGRFMEGTLWGQTSGVLRCLIFALLHFYVLQFVPVLIAGIRGVLFIRSKSLRSFLGSFYVNSLVLVFWLFPIFQN